MRRFSTNQQQQLISDMLYQMELKEHDFPIINENGNTHYPVLSKNGIVIRDDVKEGYPKGYRGLALEINDHGNVTVWNCFKNGNRRELASRV